LPAQREHRLRRRDVKLDVAGHANVSCAERRQPFRIVRGLRRNRGKRFQALARERSEASIAAERFFRQARVHEIARDSARAAGVDEVGPDLRFHDDPGARPEVVKKSRDGPRQVVRQIAPGHAVAEELMTGLAAGGCHMGQQNMVVRMALPQQTDDGLCRAGLADRDRVQPDDRLLHRAGIGAEAFRHVVEIAALAPRAPQEAQRYQ
jgi:hypothetical protein